MSFRSFPCIEQFNAAYKRQEKTGLHNISQRYLYMYYTDAHIRAWVNTTITRIYGLDEQRRQSLRKSAERLSINTRALVGQFQSPFLAVHLSIGIEVFMTNYYQVVILRCVCLGRQRWTLRDKDKQQGSAGFKDNRKQLKCEFSCARLRRLRNRGIFLTE